MTLSKELKYRWFRFKIWFWKGYLKSQIKDTDEFIVNGYKAPMIDFKDHLDKNIIFISLSIDISTNKRNITLDTSDISE